MLTHLRIIKHPTIVSAPPVAHEGMDAKIGAKNIETKNMTPVVIAVNPVFPPSMIKCWIFGKKKWKGQDSPLIPVALSMYAVTGLQPTRAPMLMEKASTQ